MTRRFDAGPAVAVLGAAILAVALFLDWFDPGVTAWQAFESLDLVLIVLAGGVAFAALRPDGPNGRAMLIASVAAFLVVVTQLLQPPPIIDATGSGDPTTGAWLGLVGTLLAVAGSVLVVASISINVDVAGRDGRRRATAVDRRDGVAADLDDTDLDDEAQDDDGAERGALRRAVRPAQVPPVRPAGGSLFSRGPVAGPDEDEDEPEDTQAAPLDTQATQAFPAATSRDDDPDDDRPASVRR